MASSSTAICNLALQRLGVSNLIADLDEDTPEAEACALWYDQKLEELLKRARWSWATRRALLAEIATPDERLSELYTYVYALPTDCLKPLELSAGTSAPSAAERPKWRPEWDSSTDAQVLCTEQEDAVLVYVAKIEVVTRYPADFVSALAWSLAAELALPLLKDRQVAALALQAAEAAYLAALANDSNGSQAEDEAESTLISSRN